MLPITLLPFDEDPAPVLTLAAADPSDQAVLEDVRRGLPYKVHVVAALREEIMKCLDRLYGPAPAQRPAGGSQQDVETRSDPTGVKLLGKLIDELALSGSTTLRIRGSEGKTVCRDGNGKIVFEGPGEWLAILLERARVLAGIAPEARRGRLHYLDGSGGDVLLRVLILNTMEGEELHLRVVPPENGERSLSDLGFSARQAETARTALNRPGLILVAARGGGGLISTLYALLRECGRENSIAIEEEVVYRSGKTTQVEVSRPGEVSELLRDLKYMEFGSVLVGHADRGQLPDLLALARRNKLVLAGIEEAGLAETLSALTEVGRNTPLLGLSMVIFQNLTPLAGSPGRYSCDFKLLETGRDLLEKIKSGDIAAAAGQAD